METTMEGLGFNLGFRVQGWGVKGFGIRKKRGVDSLHAR